MPGPRPVTPLALALLAAGLLPAPAARAEEPDPAAPGAVGAGAPSGRWLGATGWIELGTYLSGDDSFKFGDYTGLEDDQVNVLGNFDVWGRAPWESGETWHWRARGQNLGLDSRLLSVEYGRQGLFDLWLELEQLPKLRSDSSRTIYGNEGGAGITLPAGWVPAGTTGGFAALAAALNDLDVRHDRRALRGGLGLVLPGSLELVADYEYETKEGRKVVGTPMGNNAGNARSVLAPEPIDYRTNELDLALRHNGERAQLELAYRLSHFENHDEALTFQSPWTLLWNPAADFTSDPALLAAGFGQGRKATAPDNRFHQVSLSGGYSLPGNTRVSAHAGLGFMRQDDAFLPYTVNSGLLVPLGLPRRDADAKIDTTALGLQVTSRPLPKLRLEAALRYDDRDNETGRDVYFYVPGDSLDQDPDPAGNFARLNLPFSYQLKEARAEVGYEVLERTELSVGFEREEIERTFTEVDETSESIYSLRLRSRPWRFLDLRAGASRGQRDGSEYVDQSPLFESFPAAHVAALFGDGIPGNEFENHPLLRKYNLADRDRDQVFASVTLLPVERVSLGFRVDHRRDDYDDSLLGLTFAKATTWGVDASWTPTDTLSTYAFYTFEDLKSRQRGRSFTGTCAPPPAACAKVVQATNPLRDWVARDTDSIDTLGAGAEWRPLGERLRLRADYVYSKAKTLIDVGTGPALAAALPFPDAISRLHDLSLRAEYQLRSGIWLRVGYLLEQFDVDDWSLDGVEAATISQVVTVGQNNPDYRAHVVAFSVVWEF